jgi:hypothetical protein
VKIIKSRLKNGRPLTRPRPAPYWRASSRPYFQHLETLHWYWRSVFVSMLGVDAAAARLEALASHTLCIEIPHRTTQNMLVSVFALLPASFPAADSYGAVRFKVSDCTEILVEFHQYGGICADVGNCEATTPRFTSNQLTTRTSRSDLNRVEVRQGTAPYSRPLQAPPIRPKDYSTVQYSNIHLAQERWWSDPMRPPHWPAKTSVLSFPCCWVGPPCRFKMIQNGVKTTVPRLCVLRLLIQDIACPPSRRGHLLQPFLSLHFLP